MKIIKENALRGFIDASKTAFSWTALASIDLESSDIDALSAKIAKKYKKACSSFLPAYIENSLEQRVDPRKIFPLG